MNILSKSKDKMDELQAESRDRFDGAMKTSKFLLVVNIALFFGFVAVIITGQYLLTPILMVILVLMIWGHERYVTAIIEREIGFLDGIAEGMTIMGDGMVAIIDERTEELEAKEKEEKKSKK
jgi:hypothetical protein